MLFLICFYISSRALSKVFEHRNFVARYRRETNHICESFAPLETMDARLAYNIGRNIHIHNKLFYLLRQKMIYEHIAVLWLFFYLMSFSTVYTIQAHSFYFLFQSCICWRSKTKVSRLTLLFAVLYLFLLKSIAALKFHTFCNSFMNTAFKFLY